MLKKYLPILFVLIFNLWIYRILYINFLVGVTVFAASFFLWRGLIKNDRKDFIVFIVLMTCLLSFQYRTSSINSLAFLNEGEKILQIQKMHAYPQPFFRMANWLEARQEALVFYKLEANFSEAVDPNLFFFANHPRERPGIVEYEKFAYILLPFFVLGILSLKKANLKYLLASLTPLVLISFIGNSNPLGPFSLFPLVTANIAVGLTPVFDNKKYLVIFIMLFILVFGQTITYATH